MSNLSMQAGPVGTPAGTPAGTLAGTPTPLGTLAGPPVGPPAPPTYPPTPAPVKSKYQRNMKVPSDIGSFKGDNVSDYLRKYNLLAEDCGIEGHQKLSRFTAYGADEIVTEVESRVGYKLGDWEVYSKSTISSKIPPNASTKCHFCEHWLKDRGMEGMTTYRATMGNARELRRN